MATMDAEPCFIDTNILLAATETNRLNHADAKALLKRGLIGTLRLFASGQILREYLVVATRPQESNGLGLRSRNAVDNIQSFRKCLQILDENDATARRLERLITEYKLKGKRIHDANTASIMIENGLSRIYTLNADDFKAIEQIQAIDL